MKEYKLKSFLTNALRRASYKWPSRNVTLTKARISRGVYKCNCCDGHFGRREVQVDHIDPVIPVTGWDSWDGYISRMFCDEAMLQTICISCHNSKSYLENQLRKQNKKINDEDEIDVD